MPFAKVWPLERNNRGLDETFLTGDRRYSRDDSVGVINSGSASASEIVAGAIQDWGRAVPHWRNDSEKGSVQQIHPLRRPELRVTIARWYTPNNNTIDGNRESRPTLKPKPGRSGRP